MLYVSLSFLKNKINSAKTTQLNFLFPLFSFPVSLLWVPVSSRRLATVRPREGHNPARLPGPTRAAARRLLPAGRDINRILHGDLIQ